MADKPWSDGTFWTDTTGWADDTEGGATSARSLQHRRWLYWPASAPTGLPLDSYTTNLSCVFSTRRMLTSYTGALINVRSSAGPTGDIGYDGSGNLDTTALATLVGANSGFIVTYYDQSGLGNHATQTTAAEQWRIVNAGTNEVLNSRPCGYSVAANDGAYATGTGIVNAGTTASAVAVWRWGASIADYDRLLSITAGASFDYDATANSAMILGKSTGPTIQTYRNTDLANNLSLSLSTTYAAAVRFDSTLANLRQGSNTTSAASTGSFNTNRVILCGENNASPKSSLAAKYAEFAVWTSNIGDTAAQAILAEQRTYWSAS